MIVEAFVVTFILLVTFLIGLGLGYLYGSTRNIDDE